MPQLQFMAPRGEDEIGAGEKSKTTSQDKVRTQYATCQPARTMHRQLSEQVFQARNCSNIAAGVDNAGGGSQDDTEIGRQIDTEIVCRGSSREMMIAEESGGEEVEGVERVPPGRQGYVDELSHLIIYIFNDNVYDIMIVTYIYACDD